MPEVGQQGIALGDIWVSVYRIWSCVPEVGQQGADFGGHLGECL